MKTRTTIISLICLLTFGAFTGMAQTLTCTFQFTASGTIGTHTFTGANIVITAVSTVSNRQVQAYGYYIANDSVSVSISGVGTFQVIPPTKTNIGILNMGFSNNLPPGVVSNGYLEIEFYITGGGQLSTFSYPSSVQWTMLSSLGPLEPTPYTISGWNQSPVTTSGGTLNLYDSNTLLTFQGIASSGAVTPPPNIPLIRSGVLSHIAAGGWWTTVITLVNTSSAAVPVTVALHNDDGSAMTLPVTTRLQGTSQTTTTSSVSATINPNATLLISMGDPTTATFVGWADVLSTGSIGGYAIFRSTPQPGLPSEGTVPLETQYPTTITLPYDNTAGFVMGVALANLSTSFASVTVTMWDDNGNSLGTQFLSIAGNGHTSFVLSNQFPLTAGKMGIVRFQSSGGLAGLGLRFSPFGTFTSVPTM